MCSVIINRAQCVRQLQTANSTSLHEFLIFHSLTRSGQCCVMSQQTFDSITSLILNEKSQFSHFNKPNSNRYVIEINFQDLRVVWRNYHQLASSLLFWLIYYTLFNVTCTSERQLMEHATPTHNDARVRCMHRVIV